MRIRGSGLQRVPGRARLRMACRAGPAWCSSESRRDQRDHCDASGVTWPMPAALLCRTHVSASSDVLTPPSARADRKVDNRIEGFRSCPRIEPETGWGGGCRGSCLTRKHGSIDGKSVHRRCTQIMGTASDRKLEADAAVARAFFTPDEVDLYFGDSAGIAGPDWSAPA